jgi:hypothetical protein
MSARPFTKAQRREVRRLTGLAHERELSTAAGRLQSEFDRWRRGEIDVFILNECIHKFHDGTSRELYKDMRWARQSGVLHQRLLAGS